MSCISHRVAALSSLYFTAKSARKSSAIIPNDHYGVVGLPNSHNISSWDPAACRLPEHLIFRSRPLFNVHQAGSHFQMICSWCLVLHYVVEPKDIAQQRIVCCKQEHGFVCWHVRIFLLGKTIDIPYHSSLPISNSLRFFFSINSFYLTHPITSKNSLTIILEPQFFPHRNNVVVHPVPA